MFKNFVQTVLATFAAVVFALGWSIVLGYTALIIVAVLAAFEEKKWLSSTEVLFAAVTIAICSTWYMGLTGAALIALWNAAFWITPLRTKLIEAG